MVNIHEDERSLAKTDARGYQEKAKTEKNCQTVRCSFTMSFAEKITPRSWA